MRIGILLLNKTLFFLGGICLFGVSNMAAADYTNEDYEETPDWIEKPRVLVGEVVNDMTRTMDDFFSQNNDDIVNESYLKLRLGQGIEENGHTFSRNDLKLKIDLPKTENRWSLIFETDPDEFESLEEQNQNRKSDNTSIRNTDGTIGAVRVMLNEWNHWRSDFDVGLKAPLPLNSFVRFNLNRNYRVNEHWRAHIRHSVYYFHNEGFGERSRFDLHRQLSNTWFFTNFMDMQWQHEEEDLEFGEIISFQQRATRRDTFTYRSGIFYEEHPGTHVKSYFVDVRYRRRLHSDWLYGEIIPDITWSKVNNFNRLASINFRLEIYFRQ